MKYKNVLRNNYYLKAFNYGLVLAIIMFLPFIIANGGVFTFYGELNVQQIAFYELAHNAILEGNISWSGTTDLGANFIGVYSSYVLGSPFFWITLLFSNDLIQYLMGPFLIIKFALASLTACVYLHRYVKNKNYAIMGGVLYAFSGFAIYNIFLGHYFEPIIIFPLILSALDAYVLDKKRGFLVVAIFASCIVNYSFVVGQLVFVAVYTIVRFATGSYKSSVKEGLLLIFEIILGIIMAMILLLPAVSYVLSCMRDGGIINGVNALVYEDSVHYLDIIQSLFFPVDVSTRTATSNLSAVGAWLPLFGMTGVFAWMQQKRKHWLKKLLYILFFVAFVPILNSIFSLFSEDYSAVWYYILTLMMVLATILSLENDHVNFKRAIKYCTFVTVLLTLACGLVPNTTEVGGEFITTLGISDNPERFWWYAGLVFISISILTCIIRFIPKEKTQKYLIISLTIICTAQGMYFISDGVEKVSYINEYVTPYELDINTLDIDDLANVRSDFYSVNGNDSMFIDIPSIQAFYGSVSGSIMDFYDYLDVDCENYLNLSTSDYVIRAITSVRWLFDDVEDDQLFGTTDYDTPLMVGFHYYGTESGYDIWENLYYISMGFEYDSYITVSETENLSSEEKQLLMLKTAVVQDEDEEIWAKYFNKYNINEAIFSQDLYYTDCIARASSTVDNFTYTNTGFTAISNSDEDRMIFFSVPYDSGWTAYVDGVETEILQTNIGFMSIYVPAKQNSSIQFVYRTPGLNIGIVLTATAILIFVFYIRFSKVLFKTNKKTNDFIKHTRKYEKFDKYCKQTGFKRGKNGIKLKEKTYE